ncbi:class I SAM-dependent methyltransferase [Nocardia sp. NPDC052566]|uniref:class I SAM-dependent methyltransferase n=1 Tax=Nocardia sp. NPDC052566 TaxID=3364330 RepID=UPI0037CB9C26
MRKSNDERGLRARRARSFGPHAADYAEHRPDYPAAGIRWALEPVASEHIPTVLDLGAGTGKLTEGLLAVGASVLAVEPDEAMRAELLRRHPEVTAHPGTAEAIPLPDASVDAVLAGQAFHWFDPERAFPEIARVLRTGGVFAALWNENDVRVAWVAGLNRLTQTAASVPGIQGADTLPPHPLFPSFDRAVFAHSQRRTAESLAATIGTHSHTLVIPERDRTVLLDRITAYLRTTPETARGEFDLPLVTSVIRAVL